MNLSVTNTFIPNTTIRSAEANENFSDIVNWANGNIGSDNIDVLIDTLQFSVGGDSEAIHITSTANVPALEIEYSGTAVALAIENSGAVPGIQVAQSGLSSALAIAQFTDAAAVDVTQQGSGPALNITHSGAADQADASALTVDTTTKGVLLPRLTTVQRLAIATPVIGLTVYDTDIQTYLVYNGTVWQSLQITPAGSLLEYSGLDIPAGYLECDNTTYSRTTYLDLFTAITSVRAGTRSNGNPQVTAIASTSRLWAGMAIEATGFVSGTTIVSVDSGTQVTLSNNASGNGTMDVRYFPHGNGNGTTTFNVPDFRRRVSIGAGGTPISFVPNGIGQADGEEGHVLALGEMAAHNHGNPSFATGSHVHKAPVGQLTPFPDGDVVVGDFYGNAAANFNTTNNMKAQNDNVAGTLNIIRVALTDVPSATGGLTTDGSGDAFNIMQPSMVVMKLIKY